MYLSRFLNVGVWQNWPEYPTVFSQPTFLQSSSFVKSKQAKSLFVWRNRFSTKTKKVNFLRTTAANSYKSVPCSFLLKSVCTNKMTTLQLIQRSSGKAKMMILRTMMMMTREVSMKQWVALSGEGTKQEVSTNFLCWRQTDMKNTPKSPCKKYHNSFPSKSAKLRAAIERPLLQSVWEMTGVAHCTVSQLHIALLQSFTGRSRSVTFSPFYQKSI